jgi:LPS O-antigen subunit length determinant protein (WzzB/FepE family)
MIETQKTQYKDEIKLIDIIRVIWKRKILIIVGTLSCALGVAGINFLLPKIYDTYMVVQPGILKISQSGAEKNIYIDSAENMKAIIAVGTFNSHILQALNETGKKNIPDKIEYKISVPKNSNTLQIVYETENIENGITVLTNLKDLLSKEYEKLVNYHKAQYELEKEIKKNEIKKLVADKSAYINNIKNLEKRILQLSNEIEEVNQSTKLLAEKRDRFLSQNANENNVLSALLYSNSIQNNLALANDYKEQINEYRLRREEAVLGLKKVENDIADIDENIKYLLFQKDSIQNIQILQPPISDLKPVKPKKILNIVLASLVGLFFMLFLAFFVEYLSRHKVTNDGSTSN